MRIALDHGEDARHQLHDINVMPFVDVMLVLLIIFMVAAPLATVHVGINLPPASDESQPRSDGPLYLTVKPGLSLALGNDAVGRERLPGMLDAATEGDKNGLPISLRADKAVSYGELMEVMNLLCAVGYLKVKLAALEKMP